MKKIKLIQSIVLSILTLAACNSLNLSPLDYYGSGNFWKNEAQVQGYVAGLSANLRGQYNTIFTLGELRGGTQRTGTSSVGTSLDGDIIKNNALTKDKTGISNWAGIYSNIFQINLFINELTNGTKFLSESKRNYYLAIGYGLRAYEYFLLYRTFGGVPIVNDVKLLDGQVSAEKFYDKRATASQTIEFIKEDLTKSEQLFGDAQITNNFNKTIWSKAATLMLKAEVYLWTAKVSVDDFTAQGQADLKIAEQSLEQIMGKFSLMENFADIWSNNLKNNKEEILTLHFQDGEATNNISAFLSADNLFINQVYTPQGNRITTDTLNLKGRGGPLRNEYNYAFYSSFDQDDSRRDATFFAFYTSNTPSPETFGCVMVKALGSINSNNLRVFDSDYVLYRYADALLMMAEVKNALGQDPSDYINQVRRRAYKDKFTGHEFVNKSKFENDLAILHERDKEFVWEGKRWFDVVRFHHENGKSLALTNEGNYPATSPLIDSEHLLLWPIDINTLNVNPELTQTPGYE